MYVCGDNHFKRFELYRKPLCDGVVCVPKTAQSNEEIANLLAMGGGADVILAHVEEAESYEVTLSSPRLLFFTNGSSQIQGSKCKEHTEEAQDRS